MKKHHPTVQRLRFLSDISHLSDSIDVNKDREDCHLVLSGSGMKLYTFVSAIYAMHCFGYRFTEVTGTSGGAIVAAKVASLYDPQSDRFERGKALQQVISDTLSYDVGDMIDPQWFIWRVATSLSGIVKGKKITKFMNRELPSTFDDLKMPCHVTAFQINLEDPVTRVISDGCLPSAVRASMSIPGVFSPVRRGDSLLVDGGVQMNLPLPDDGNGVVALTFGTGSNESLVEVHNNIQMLMKLADGAVDAGIRRSIKESPHAKVIKLRTSIKSLDFFASQDDKIQSMYDGIESIIEHEGLNENVHD